MLVLGLFLFNGALFTGCQAENITGFPENVTVHVIDSRTVEIIWSTASKNVDRYDVTYNPAEDKIVTQAAGDSRSIVLRELKPNTQYQVTVSAVVNGKGYKSPRLVFKTGNSTRKNPADFKPRTENSSTTKSVNPDPMTVGSKYTPQTSSTVRGIEIGLVLLALVVWIIAISLFFHRWGKIRMLLPYQPDYKTQQSLKVPGTGTTASSARSGSNGFRAGEEGQDCIRHLRWSFRQIDERTAAASLSPSKWTSKSRVSPAMIPAPSFLYARSSTECESPLAFRQVRSHNDLSEKVVSPCQVPQLRVGTSTGNALVKVPAFDGSVQTNSMSEDKKDLMLGSERARSAKETETSNFCFFVGKDYLSVHCPQDSPKSKRGLASQSEVSLKKESHLKSESFSAKKDIEIESFDGNHATTGKNTVECENQSEKPKRYNRSSFVKQNARYCEDCEPGTPICGSDQMKYLNRIRDDIIERKKLKQNKMEEIKRKAFFRKVSLQDTYLNYNQDYWLDFRKLGQNRKSIDLGYLGNENASSNEEPEKKVYSSKKENKSDFQSVDRNGQSPALRLKTNYLMRCDSDPLAFTKNHSCENLYSADLSFNSLKSDFRDHLKIMISRCKKRQSFTEAETEAETKPWPLPASNENIQLFSKRNGLIETDFDVFNADCKLPKTPAIFGDPALDENHSKFSKCPSNPSAFQESKLKECRKKSEEEASNNFPFRCCERDSRFDHDNWNVFEEIRSSAICKSKNEMQFDKIN